MDGETKVEGAAPVVAPAVEVVKAKRGRPRNEAKFTIVHDLYIKLGSTIKVAKALNCSAPAVYNMLKSRGVQLRAPGRPAAPKVEAAPVTAPAETSAQ